LVDFGTTVTNQIYIHDDIKSEINSGNPCYHSLQKIFISMSPIQNPKD